MNSQYISITDFAAMLGKSRYWIYRKIGTETIPNPVRIGNTLRWELREVEKWLKGLSKVGERKPRRKRTTGVKKGQNDGEGQNAIRHNMRPMRSTRRL